MYISQILMFKLHVKLEYSMSVCVCVCNILPHIA